MVMMITVGSIIRFFNTILAAYFFARGDILLGTVFTGFILLTIYLEVKREEDAEE